MVSPPERKQHDNDKEEMFGRLEVRNTATGKTVKVAVNKGTVRATDLRLVKTSRGKSLMVFDPGYFNTAACRSQITFVDGDKGILLYRGYPIEQLVQHSNFIEVWGKGDGIGLKQGAISNYFIRINTTEMAARVAYLLIFGNLPCKDSLERWEHRIMRHTFIHENQHTLLQSFRYDAHPMGIMISCISAMSTFYPDANPSLQGSEVFQDRALREKQIFRLIGKIPTIAACTYRHRIGRPYNYPKIGLDYISNFLSMIDSLNEPDYEPAPIMKKALNILFIVHADHELNCSTATMRQLGSTLVDPYSATAGACCALYGPLHGGANEAVLKMLTRIGKVENVPEFLEMVKAKKTKLMGFGHRLYKNFDPRSKVLHLVTAEILEEFGNDPLFEVAQALEKAALNDDYFVKRKLYPNVDFYSGLIYKAMGFPPDMFPVLFSIPRVVGWLAHWLEGYLDSDTHIFRPHQIYEGYCARQYVPLSERSAATEHDLLPHKLISRGAHTRRGDAKL